MTEFFLSMPSPIERFADPNYPVAERLAALLLVIDDYQPAYFDALMATLMREDEDVQIRSGVAMSLGKLLNTDMEDSLLLADHETVAMDTLTQLAIQESNDSVRAYVITALGMSGRGEVIHAVVEALKDPDLKVFHNAAEALGSFDRLVVPHLIEQLEHGANDAKCIAAWKLGELGYTEALPPLLAVLANDKETIEVQALSVWALGEIGHQNGAVKLALQQALRHPDPEIHERAKLALKKIARNVN